jgi:hypothetical protein
MDAFGNKVVSGRTVDAVQAVSGFVRETFRGTLDESFGTRLVFVLPVSQTAI